MLSTQFGILVASSDKLLSWAHYFGHQCNLQYFENLQNQKQPKSQLYEKSCYAKRYKV